MQNDTMVGFILVAVMLILQVICKYLGFDGDITTAINVVIASGLLLITGKKAVSKE